jgi:tRNA-specific 2-thiouridylase
MSKKKIKTVSGLESLRPGAPVAVALSGGVDSALTARRLEEAGFAVLAFHMILSPGARSEAEAREAARVLELDLEIIDLTGSFDELVVEPFTRWYMKGLTPSPCVMCNPAVKFGLLWEHARLRGAEAMATGHYAGLTRKTPNGRPALVRPADRRKDQTYFLCRLTSEMLGRTVFPLAGAGKEDVRAESLRLGLPRREESQDICFLQGTDYRDFVRERAGEAAFAPGDFVTSSGQVVGRHRGLAWKEAFYVVGLDAANNRVVVGPKSETRSDGLRAGRAVWSMPPPAEEFDALVQIRSQHVPAAARVRLTGEETFEVRFHRPQKAAAPGQAAAVYLGDLLLGGGWITEAISDTPPPEPV